MDKVLEKYNSLPPQGQQEVRDFLDFMLTKYLHNRSFDMKAWKENIQRVSVWSDEDVKVFDENKNLFKQWKTEEW
jgi:hypothetical protein